MLSKINAALLRLYARFEQEKGQALAEYGLILALIAVVAIAGLVILGGAILSRLTGIGGSIAP
jgi:pilus assembly protein Flp/PilA